MAFGIKREQLTNWKKEVSRGNIAFITHFWYDPRFPDAKSITKVGCNDIEKLIIWGKQHGLKAEWIHQRKSYPHFDLLGKSQIEIMEKEGRFEQIKPFI